MSLRLTNDFIELERNTTHNAIPKVVPSVNQRNNPSVNVLLTPNDLKELPVVLQVIYIMDEPPPAREKLTLLEPDGSTTFFFAENQNAAVSNATRSKIVLPDGKVYVEEEAHVNTRPVFPLLHISDGVPFVQAIIQKHPLAKKCFTAGLKCGSIITVTKARTSFVCGSVGLLEIYDFNMSHLNFHVLGNPVPFLDTTIDFFKECSTKLSWTMYPMTYSGLYQVFV